MVDFKAAWCFARLLFVQSLWWILTDSVLPTDLALDIGHVLAHLQADSATHVPVCVSSVRLQAAGLFTLMAKQIMLEHNRPGTSIRHSILSAQRSMKQHLY